ncbi:hypothetical protein Poly51_03310 [Rubripirellula tenax]|uniref:Uncharacterized protein n=1 Tax=Rubripirellula tenax TaxID=2528015 RepID=A0A5C6FIZ1_9BACT|nr:hypothetical protein [Rubripirellula tenax]TWU60057.1 hypothetical protein Poly51_03310 [Rubripirellula tenax]
MTDSTITATPWFVTDSNDLLIGPMTEFELREGLIVSRWGNGARVATSQSGPWTSSDDVRRQFLNLIQNGWYVQSVNGDEKGGPFTTEKMRRLAASNSLSSVVVRSGRNGTFRSADAFESWDMPRPTIVPPESAGQPIQAKCRCPHCWKMFPPDEVRWIAAHTSLRGDSVMGAEAMRRFVASAFTAEGDAIDAAGDSCSQLACPQCHLEIPRAIIELQPTFISVVGAPGSGKSYFLASAVERICHRLAEHDMMFRDAQVDLNTVLSGYRRLLFWSDQPDSPVALPKTEPQGNLYQSVHLSGRDVWFPKPFTFRWLPAMDHPAYAERASMGRVVCLYDNAGEHFLPGSNRTGSFATDHLRRSNALLFLFDPTQHAPLRPKLKEVSDDPQLSASGRNYSQAEVLDEVLERVRRRRGVAGVDRISFPLIVAVTKADVWVQSLEGHPLPDDLGIVDINGRPGIDLHAFQMVSDRVRAWLKSSCPEMIHAAESQAEKVFYVPTSSQGISPEWDTASNLLKVRPSTIAPRWADAPLLLAMHYAAPKLLPARKA